MSEPARRHYRLTYTKGEIVRIKAKRARRRVGAMATRIGGWFVGAWVAFKRWARMRVKWPITRLIRRFMAWARR